MEANFDADYVIVGSGFGGSVSALRLSEKGYHVRVLEKGTRFAASDFPKSNWNVKRWLWLPSAGCRGIFKMTFLPHVTALSGVGVGGGSLVYANTLPVPGDEFFSAPSWGALADWKRELLPHYATAKRMLGATKVPFTTLPDEVLREVGKDIGREDSWSSTDVAVYFGEPGVTVPDPFFGGAGPERAGCTSCGGCMVGCRHGAKNTLDKNYLWLAEKLGAKVEADTEVTWVRPRAGGGFEVTARKGRALLPFLRKTRTIAVRNIVFAGGVLGTVELLLKLKEQPNGLPGISDRLGDFVRTNSEVLMGVVTERRDVDLSTGIAIGSILKTDEHSHLEPVRYPAGSGFFRPLAMPHAPGDTVGTRLLNAAAMFVKKPWATLRAAFVPDWAKYTMILLYMRTSEGTLRMKLGRGIRTMFRRGLTTGTGSGPQAKAWVPEATELARRIEKKLDGYAESLATETLLGIPTTAHILGGCCMGTSAANGVIDEGHRVFGYDGLYVIDGSSVSANPGVNPSLTITALAERAMSRIPSNPAS
ncbi:MAG TPA: GMC family oxidoreductase [Thermoanaerobaculia bacterium]